MVRRCIQTLNFRGLELKCIHTHMYDNLDHVNLFVLNAVIHKIANVIIVSRRACWVKEVVDIVPNYNL